MPVTIAEEGIPKREFSDDYDIIKSITDIHSTSEGISKDFVLFNSTEEKLRTFITEQFKVARKLRSFIQDKKTGEKVYSGLMAEIILLAVLNRNDPENFMVRKLLTRTTEPTTEEKHEEERKSLIDRLLRRETKTEEEPI